MNAPPLNDLERPRPNVDASKAAIRLAGGVMQTARKLNVRRYQRVQSWERCGIPVPYCARVERLLNGAFTRRDFYPDDWREIWPEMVPEDRREGACV